MSKRKQLQAWIFNAFTLGELTVYVRKGASAEEVRKYLDSRYSGGNWDGSSLRKGKKLKVKPACEVIL